MKFFTNNKKSFKGGIHPEEYKHYTENLPVESMPVPGKVVIPLSQHIGAPCEPLVKKGDQVLAGQKIGESSSFISAPVHASVSGKVISVEEQLYPLGTKVLSVTIKADEEQKDCFSDLPKRDLETLEPAQIKEIIKEAGIVGLGGATFPTYVKLSPPKGKSIDIILINGCECEPFLTADYRVMLEQARDLVQGAVAAKKATGARKIIIGIEVNKLRAIEKLKDLTRNQEDIIIQPLEVKYPQGAEKMLIKAATGREVPAGKLPLDVGAVVLNIGTTVAITEALRDNKPLIDRVLTVSGDGVEKPRNLRVKVGTLFSEVLAACGGLKEGAGKVIMGGPMMGISQPDTGVPVIKGTSGITCLTQLSEKEYEYGPCIKCGRCVQACPLGMVPSELGRMIEGRRYELLEDSNIMNCMECGCCVFICPAKRPMVQWVKTGKAKLKKKKRKQ